MVHVLPNFVYETNDDSVWPVVKSAYQKINFLISQPKQILFWVLKRTV